MKLHLPWQKAQPLPTPRTTDSAGCTHPRVDVEMHGTAIKRRWCIVCGQDLPVVDKGSPIV